MTSRIPLFITSLAGLTLGLFLVPASTSAQTNKVLSEIRDDAKLFSEAAVKSVRSDLERIERNYKVPITVETVQTLRNEPISDVALKRARQLNHQGVLILIAKQEHRATVLASNPLAKDLNESRGEKIRNVLTDEFRAGRMDEGLKRCIQATATNLAEILPGVSPLVIGTPTAPPPASTPAPAATPATSTTPSPASSTIANPLVIRQQVRLTLSGARAVLAGAEAKALQMSWKMNIAVVDDGGHLLAFARMDGARPASVATATTKAITAATFRQATGPLPVGTTSPDLLLNLSVQNAALASGGKITTLLGGVPIVVDGEIIGAVGVGGGSGEQDAEAARAGIDAFLKELNVGSTSQK